MNDQTLGFVTRLARYLKTDLEVVVNENRSTMLNLLEKKRQTVRLSVHKMFLNAPEPVLSAIAHYVRGTGKETNILRQFIQDHLAHADYTHLVDQKKLTSLGKVYDLNMLYESLNEKYFKGRLQLSITWYGHKKTSRRRQITFGQYLAGMRLIKIHRMLDDPFFPHFFVSFVVYHEMLHSVIPGSTDRRGRFCFHNAHFRSQERLFEHYQQAVEWEKNNRTKLFKYGWT